MEVNTEELSNIANCFRALGDPTRLRIFLYLASCGQTVQLDPNGDAHPVGITVGSVCCHLTGFEKSNSVVSHHIKELRNAGLISTTRSGRHILCSLNQLYLDRLAQILSDAPVTENEVVC